MVRRLLPIAFLAALGCDGDAEGDDDDQGTTGTPASGCELETRDDDYALGLERSGERVTVRFVDAMPAPPARYDNTWIVEVVDVATGLPIPDAVLEVDPTMPDHNHGTSIQCEVTAMDEPGQFRLDPVNLFMPGLWEVELEITLADTATDQVVFKFCVDP